MDPTLRPLLPASLPDTLPDTLPGPASLLRRPPPASSLSELSCSADPSSSVLTSASEPQASSEAPGASPAWSAAGWGLCAACC